MKIEFYPEECCDHCNSTIHTHMDCPACKDDYASTSKYGDIYELDIGDVLECEECHAKFKLLCKDGWIDEYEWEQVT